MARNATLDFIRGIAILGILLLNIVAFALPKAAYLNPAWQGSVNFADTAAWIVITLFAQGKFLSLFALLFGAGLQMLLNRGKNWIIVRLTFLCLLGLCHALFFWDGDILLAYGLIGLLLWRMIRNAANTRMLLTTGIVLYVAGVSVLLLLGLLPHSLSSNSWTPDDSSLLYERYWHTVGGIEGIINRADLLSTNIVALVIQYGWQLAGMMLIGASLMRSGWLQGKYDSNNYRRQGYLFIIIGLLIHLPGIIGQWLVHWDYHWSALLLQIPCELSAPIQTIGYTSLIIGFWPYLSRFIYATWIADVGRMALSSYLLQTLICTTIFYHLKFYMMFTRAELLCFLPMIWMINIVFSIIWLRYFHQGPVEWVWRRLTSYFSGLILSLYCK